jgi:hypothetical protein
MARTRALRHAWIAAKSVRVGAGNARAYWTGLWGLVALAASSPSEAAEILIAAPSVCAIGDELSFRAERALGQPLEAAAPVRCTIYIARSGGVYGARFEVEAIGSPQPPRLRSFSAPTCVKLTETLALAVVLAIGAGANDPEAPSPRASEPPGGPGLAGEAAGRLEHTQQADRPPPPDLPERETSGGLRFGANAALVADAGTLPGVGLGAALGLALGGEALEMRLTGTYLPPRDVSIDGSGAGSPGAELELLAGGLDVCAPRLLEASELALGACAGAELGWLAGTGTDLALSRSGGTWWSAARVEAVARWGLGRGWGLDLLLTALAPLERDEFAVDGVGRVFRPGHVVGRAGLGLSLELDGPATARP